MNTKNATATASRPLNMEEKRKLEKIIFQDIDKAKSQYDSKRSEAENDLKAKLLERPQGLKLLAEYVANQKEEKRLKNEIGKLGMDFNHSNDKGITLQMASYYSYGSDTDRRTPTEITTFNAKTSQTKDRLEEMKRTYTLKLFASGMEAQEVFTELSKELAKIVNG